MHILIPLKYFPILQSRQQASTPYSSPFLRPIIEDMVIALLDATAVNIEIYYTCIEGQLLYPSVHTKFQIVSSCAITDGCPNLSDNSCVRLFTSTTHRQCMT